MTWPLLIGFAGPAGSGKSSAAAVLALGGWELVSFAAPIKLAVAAGLEIDELELERRKRDGDGVVRGWLRTIGDHGRGLDPSLYIRVAAEAVADAQAKSRSVVVDDVRMPQEAAWIRELGGHVVHVQRAGVKYSRAHGTEFGPPFETGDLVLSNPAGPRALRGEVDHLVLSLLRAGAA